VDKKLLAVSVFFMGMMFLMYFFLQHEIANLRSDLTHIRSDMVYRADTVSIRSGLAPLMTNTKKPKSARSGKQKAT
jgi:hypothetical protein